MDGLNTQMLEKIANGDFSRFWTFTQEVGISFSLIHCSVSKVKEGVFDGTVHRFTASLFASGLGISMMANMYRQTRNVPVSDYLVGQIASNLTVPSFSTKVAKPPFHHQSSSRYPIKNGS